jgi:hypothetical protein
MPKVENMAKGGDALDKATNNLWNILPYTLFHFDPGEVCRSLATPSYSRNAVRLSRQMACSRRERNQTNRKNNTGSKRQPSP